MKWIDRSESHADRIAVINAGEAFRYREVIDASSAIASFLLQGGKDLAGERVALMASPGFRFVAALWGIWRAGGVAVPLCLSHPRPELEHVLRDSDASWALFDSGFVEVLSPLARDLEIRPCQLEEIPAIFADPAFPTITGDHPATLFYTSGTTGKPKGVVATHGNFQAQVETLRTSWGWQKEDRILNVLPLHHVHGLVNIQGCALWSGATWESLGKFDADAVWERLASGEITLFMAVPTIYHRLIRAWQSKDSSHQRKLSEGAARLRLMVSGSAALPVQVLESWQRITGHVLLERYGMTEIGMALSNPLEGNRRPGHVGQPLPGVDVRLVDEHEQSVPAGEPGELRVRGPAVFSQYWRQPQETAEAFRDGWFLTGDVAVFEQGSYRILGRSSVDIIKTGGYKVSALEVESVLRDHPGIQDCAVVGLQDPEWGQVIAAALVVGQGFALSEDELRPWTQEILAPYKLPRKFLVIEELPRNALGKVIKPRVAELFLETTEDTSSASTGKS